MSEVSIYDPNYLNPYGVELAATINNATGRRVELIVPLGKNIAAIPNVRVSPILTPKNSTGVRKAMSRISGPLRAVVRSGRSDLVVVWTRDLLDATVFSARSLLGARTFFILHNPHTVRGRSIFGRIGERILMRSATVCVHSEAMARAVASVETSVTPHPAYMITTEQISPHANQTEGQASTDRRPRVAILGGLRADKGVSLLASIAAASGGGWDLVVVGAGRMPVDVQVALSGLGVNTIHPFGAEPSDAQVNETLVSCDVLIAPYTAVTESGSIILAHSLGLPTLALDSLPLHATLNEASLARDATVLGETLRKFLCQPWTTYKLSAASRQATAEAAWRRLLE